MVPRDFTINPIFLSTGIKTNKLFWGKNMTKNYAHPPCPLIRIDVRLCAGADTRVWKLLFHRVVPGEPTQSLSREGLRLQTSLGRLQGRETSTSVTGGSSKTWTK